MYSRIPGLLLVLGIVIGACNVKDEGCLDLRADNFDLAADKDCDDCCTYPDLIVNIQHRFDTLSYSTTAVYRNNLDQDFRVSRIDYFLSDIQITSVEDGIKRVEERMSYICDGSESNLKVVDDAILINTQAFRFPAGDFRENIFFATGSIKMGLQDSLACIHPDSLETSHPVITTSSPLWRSSEQAFSLGRVIMQRDTSVNLNDTVWLENTTFNLEFLINKDFNTGKNDTLTFLVDYQTWFEDADLSNDNLQTLSDHILSKIPDSVIFVP